MLNHKISLFEHEIIKEKAMLENKLHDLQVALSYGVDNNRSLICNILVDIDFLQNSIQSKTDSVEKWKHS